MAHSFVILSSNNNLLAHQLHFHSQQQTTAYEAPQIDRSGRCSTVTITKCNSTKYCLSLRCALPDHDFTSCYRQLKEILPGDIQGCPGRLGSRQGYLLNDNIFSCGLCGGGCWEVRGRFNFLISSSQPHQCRLEGLTGVFASPVNDFHIRPSRRRKSCYSLIFLWTFMRQTPIFLPFL